MRPVLRGGSLWCHTHLHGCSWPVPVPGGLRDDSLWLGRGDWGPCGIPGSPSLQSVVEGPRFLTRLCRSLATKSPRAQHAVCSVSWTLSNRAPTRVH